MNETYWVILLAMIIGAASNVITGELLKLWREWRGRQVVSKGWPTTEQFRAAQPDTWQARHRRAQDKHRLRPVRPAGVDGRGATVHRARLRTHREN